MLGEKPPRERDPIAVIVAPTRANEGIPGHHLSKERGKIFLLGDRYALGQFCKMCRNEDATNDDICHETWETWAVCTSSKFKRPVGLNALRRGVQTAQSQLSVYFPVLCGS